MAKNREAFAFLIELYFYVTNNNVPYVIVLLQYSMSLNIRKDKLLSWKMKSSFKSFLQSNLSYQT